MTGDFGTWEQAVRQLLARPEAASMIRDCYYDQPTLTAAVRYYGSEEWNQIRRLLPPSRGSVLDLGAGHGITSYALARDGWHVTAVEPDPSALVGRGAIEQLSSQESLGIRTMAGTGEAIPVPDESFDLVFARQMLHHSRDLSEVCREVYRVLRPGGRFIAVRDHVISTSAQLQEFLDSHPLHRFYGGENAFTKSEYLSALRAAGFKLEAVLRSFDTVINYAPHSYESLRSEIARRAVRIFGAAAVVRTLTRADWSFRCLLMGMSQFDSRPGRLNSFICLKRGSR